MPKLNLGGGLYPEQVDSESGMCLVVGSGRNVWFDLHPYASLHGGKFGGKYDVIAVNDMAMHFPGPCKHMYSNNNGFLQNWRQARRDSFVKMFGPIQFTHSNQTGGDVTWPWPGCGTSSLGAVYTALALGYERVIVCGVPLDDNGHYFEPPWMASSFSKQVPLKGDGRIKYWADAARNVFEGRVSAQSGRLKELLA